MKVTAEMVQAIDLAIKIISEGAGKKKPTNAALANALNVTRSNINNWRSRGVPRIVAVRIETLTGGKVTRKMLRPDLFRGVGS